MKKTCILFAVTGLVAGAVSVSHAQYYVSGDFNGWSSPSANVLSGAGPIFSCAITGQTANGLNQFKISSNSWAVSWPSYNVPVKWDATGSNTIYFQPGTFSDGWFPTADRVGFGDTGSPWEIIGDFNGWDGSQPANAQMTSNGSGLYTVDYVVTNAGTYGFKFRTSGTWNSLQSGAQFMNSGNNASFATVTSPQTVRFQIDLPNGRFNIGVPPVTNQVVFAVDMSSQIQLGQFHPGYSVYVAGAFNSWPEPGTGLGLVLTNYPPYNGGQNTNIYYGTNQFVGLPASFATQYKFNENDPTAVNGGWETSNNRSVTLMTTNGTLKLPVVTFSDAYASDFLAVPTTVFFSVDMATAVGTDSHVFSPDNDNVYLNGPFFNWYPWAGQNKGNPAPAATGSQMIRVNNSTIYTNTVILPAGTPIYFEYKYGMGINGSDEATENEAAPYVNHNRAARNSAFTPYELATDTYGNMYSEPFFDPPATATVNPAGGALTIGSASGGTIPVQWLGRPGAQLQWSTNLTGNWQTLTNTDGSTWVTGTQSTNGFVSRTNWPASGGNVFFRLVKPN